MDFKSKSGLNGTCSYLTPEIFQNELYSKSSDVYAFELNVYEIMTGENPYESLTFSQIIKKNHRRWIQATNKRRCSENL